MDSNQVLDESVAASDDSIITNAETREYLLETAKWGNFLAIVGYVFLGLLVLGGIAMTASFSLVPGVPKFFGLIYAFVAGLYFFPIYYLFKFSSKMKEGLRSGSSTTVTEGFANLKSMFKFMGIFTIVILSFYGIVLLAALAAGAFR